MIIATENSINLFDKSYVFSMSRNKEMAHKKTSGKEDTKSEKHTKKPFKHRNQIAISLLSGKLYLPFSSTFPVPYSLFFPTIPLFSLYLPFSSTFPVPYSIFFPTTPLFFLYLPFTSTFPVPYSIFFPSSSQYSAALRVCGITIVPPTILATAKISYICSVEMPCS